MITLFDTRSLTGHVAIAMRRDDGAVGYLKDDVLQTLVDARGRNLARHVDDAVAIFRKATVSRILVLGFGGGAASTLLHRTGAKVLSVDREPCAKSLAELFFRAPPGLEVIVSEAEAYVGQAEPASFDGVFVDFQDSPAPPAAYLSAPFWRSLSAVLKPGGLVVVNITEWLYCGDAWRDFQLALIGGGLDAAALGDDQNSNRILVSSPVVPPMHAIDELEP